MHLNQICLGVLKNPHLRYSRVKLLYITNIAMKYSSVAIQACMDIVILCIKRNVQRENLYQLLL